jgi:hypothetical protein
MPMFSLDYNGKHYESHNPWIAALVGIALVCLLGILIILLVGTTVTLTVSVLLFTAVIILTAIAVLLGKYVLARLRHR